MLCHDFVCHWYLSTLLLLAVTTETTRIDAQDEKIQSLIDKDVNEQNKLIEQTKLGMLHLHQLHLLVTFIFTYNI